jgi:ribosomal-protein-alanine N-acetyltransferase
VIGVITLNLNLPVHEWHIGWYFLSRFTGRGYASEAGAAASDYYLDALSLDYIACGMRDDNPASFRTAQKSGFKLTEKRIGFNEDLANCNVNNFQEVGEYFDQISHRAGAGGYYFQKFNMNKIKK